MHFSDFPACTNDTYFLVIVPNHRIVFAYTMTMEGHAFSSSQVTFEFVPSQNGTNLIFTEQAAFFEKADGPKMREDGWRQLFDALAKELARQERSAKGAPMLSQQVAVDRVFHALGDPTRRAIVEKL